MTGTRALLLDERGEVMAAARGATAVLPPRAVWAEIQALRPEGNEFSLSLSDEGGSRTLLPVLVGGPAGFLVLHRGTRPEPFHQVVVHHLATAVALELAKAQAVARTERRLVGDFLDALLEGELSASEIRPRLRFLGLGASPAIAVLVARRRAPTARRRRSRRCGCWSRTGSRAARRRTCCSIQDASVVALFEAADPAEARAAAEAVAEAVLARGWAPASASACPRATRAACAAPTRRPGSPWRPPARRPGWPPWPTWAATACCWPGRRTPPWRPSRGLLGPLADYDRRQHGDLVASLRAFLEHNGNWEAAARALAVHRHTLRYRIRRIAELTGRDLDRADDRVEFWPPSTPPTSSAAGRREVGELIPTVPNWQLRPVAWPVRTWTTGVVVLASHRARVVESADRPPETGDEAMADTKVQAGARPAVPEEDGLAAIELVGVEKEFTAGATTSGPSSTSTSGSPRASSSRCWGPRAAARPPPCG